MRRAVASTIIALVILFAGTPFGSAQTIDRFDTIVHLFEKIKLSQPSLLLAIDVNLTGSTMVRRGEPIRQQTGARGGDLIEAELTQLDLSGGGTYSDEFFDVTVRLNPAQRSTGQIRVVQGDPFLADSFFDVFIVLELRRAGKTILTAANREPARIETRITALPPIETAYRGLTPVSLYDEKGVETGVLQFVQLIPAQPSHVKLKRDLLSLEKKVDRLTELLLQRLGR